METHTWRIVAFKTAFIFSPAFLCKAIYMYNLFFLKWKAHLWYFLMQLEKKKKKKLHLL